MSFRFSGDDVTDQHYCDVINPLYDYLPPSLITLIISNEGGLTPLNLYSVIECSTAGRTSSSISIRKLKISSIFSAPCSSDVLSSTFLRWMQFFFAGRLRPPGKRSASIGRRIYINLARYSN